MSGEDKFIVFAYTETVEDVLHALYVGGTGQVGALLRWFTKKADGRIKNKNAH